MIEQEIKAMCKLAVELAAVNNVILWDRQILIEKLANS